MQPHVCTCTLSAVNLLQPHVSTCTLSAARVISLCTASHSQPLFGLHSLSTAPLSNELCVVCPAPVSVFLFVPTEVPQAAAHLEVRVLHCFRPGGISSTAGCSTHSTTSKTQHQQLQLLQQWLACVRLFSLCWQGGSLAAAAFAWQHCSAAVCSACNNLEQGRTSLSCGCDCVGAMVA